MAFSDQRTGESQDDAFAAEFIRYLGVVLAAQVLRGRARATCYTPTLPTGRPPGSCPTPDPRWSSLRGCWLSLGDARVQSFEDNEFITGLRRRHREALDALVGGGELDAAVADDMGAALEEAIAHIQRQTATCYIALPSEFFPREDLLRQGDLLEEMAGKSDLDPATVAQAQAVLQRDVAWLAQFHAGKISGALGGAKVDPTAAEAMRILVDLLLDELD